MPTCRVCWRRQSGWLSLRRRDTKKGRPGRPAVPFEGVFGSNYFEQVTSALHVEGQQDFLAVEAQLDRLMAKATAVRVRMTDFMVWYSWCVEV
jgi:hypothetical protein